MDTLKIENISPFARYSSDQHIINGQQNIVGYDHRIYFCMSGCCIVTVKGVTYRLKENSFLMWHAGNGYSYASESPTQETHIISCNFDFTREKELLTPPVPPSPIEQYSLQNTICKKITFEDCKAFNDTVYIAEAPYLRESMIKIRNEYYRQQKFFRLQMNTILQDILLKVARVLNTPSQQNKHETLIVEILDYIQAEAQHNPSNAQIAERFGYHPNYLNNLIVGNTGLSLHQYLLQCKLNKALQLLIETDLSINEIARSCGFFDQLYFSKIFKQAYKQSPKFFRASSRHFNNENTDEKD